MAGIGAVSPVSTGYGMRPKKEYYKKGGGARSHGS
jgi:hypothetical protein